MSDEIRPSADSGTCGEDECPQYDGKRCSLTGCRERSCAPGWAALLAEVSRLRALVPPPPSPSGPADIFRRMQDAIGGLLATSPSEELYAKALEPGRESDDLLMEYRQARYEAERALCIRQPAPSPSGPREDCDECGGEGIVTRAFATPHDQPCPECSAAPSPGLRDRGLRERVEKLEKALRRCEREMQWAAAHLDLMPDEYAEAMHSARALAEGE